MSDAPATPERDPDAAVAEGVRMLGEGRAADAVTRLTAARTAHPDDAGVLHFLGLALVQCGEDEAGFDLMARSATCPGGAERVDFALNHGGLLRERGRAAEALTVFENAAERVAGSAKLLGAAGQAALALGDAARATAHLERALDIDPADASAWSGLGHARRAGRNHDAALAAFETALRLRPGDPAAINNVGVTLRALGRYAEATTLYDDAARRGLMTPESLYNYANVRMDAGDHEVAVALFDQMLHLVPGHNAARIQRAFALLAAGRMTDGFRAYEARFDIEGFPTPVRVPGCKRWSGEDVSGRHVLVAPEQGYGDLIQFLRYAAVLKRRGATVSLGCPEPLRDLLTPSPLIDAAVDRADIMSGAALGADVYVYVMSLPHLLGLSDDPAPVACPYIRPTADAAVRRARLGLADRAVDDARPRIGVVWQGSRSHPNDADRSLGPDALARLTDGPGVQWIGLNQRDPDDSRPLAALPRNALDLAPGIRDFADLAAAVDVLDAVVTVDTAFVHLAGAMGARAFLLLPFASDWRWAGGGTETRWYPSVTLLRQSKPGGWHDPIRMCHDELAALTRES